MLKLRKMVRRKVTRVGLATRHVGKRTDQRGVTVPSIWLCLNPGQQRIRRYLRLDAHSVGRTDAYQENKISHDNVNVIDGIDFWRVMRRAPTCVVEGVVGPNAIP